MEALIHHFKMVTEGVEVPAGEVYQAVESPRGELGFYVVSDGEHRPYRVKIRDPSFVNLQATPTMVEGHLVADAIAAIASHRPRDGRAWTADGHLRGHACSTRPATIIARYPDGPRALRGDAAALPRAVRSGSRDARGAAGGRRRCSGSPPPRSRPSPASTRCTGCSRPASTWSTSARTCRARCAVRQGRLRGRARGGRHPARRRGLRRRAVHACTRRNVSACASSRRRSRSTSRTTTTVTPERMRELIADAPRRRGARARPGAQPMRELPARLARAGRPRAAGSREVDA